MSQNSKNNLIFRNFLTSDLDATKALAFTPDIVPHFGDELTAATLISEYNSFISLPLQPNEINLIYIRAATTGNVPLGAKTAVVMRAVPSELILWPQAWNKVKPLGPGPLVFENLSSNEIVALNVPFLINPSPMGGVPYAFVATQSPVLPETTVGDVRLRDALPAPPADVHNWTEYLNFINNDTSTAYYNVVVADPKAHVISISTRLHVVDDGTSDINFDITIENSAMPDGTFVAISSSDSRINMGKTSLSPTTDVGIHAALPPGFDEMLTLTIYPPADALIETFAWVSLQASVVVSTPDLSGGAPITNVYLLGAQNVVFHDDATTNLRFASQAANHLRRLTAAGASVEPAPSARIAIPTTLSSTVTASGWWFRDQMNDTNNYPRTESLYYSPDIQPVGGTPLSDVQASLGGSNANTDYTSAHNIELSQGAPNYIYVRGNCTAGEYTVQVRLFSIPNNLLLYPTNYAQYSVTDVDSKGNPQVAIRSITSPDTGSFNVLDTPFDLLNPQPLPAGNDHYCLIAETRHPTTSNPDPDWPHEDTGAFSSSTGFNTWVGGTPTVAWRNIAYKPGGAQLICTCIVDIPANIYPSSAEWTLQVDANYAPVGSSWQLTGSGPNVPGLQIGFAKTTITAPNMIQGCHFTGLPSSGYQFSAVLQWFAEGQTPGAGMKFSFSLHTSTPPSHIAQAALARNVRPLPDEAASWPLTVGIHHPGVEASADPSRKKHTKKYLGRRFADIGPNARMAAPGDIKPTTVYSVGGDHWNFDS